MVPRIINGQVAFFERRWRDAMDKIREYWDEDYYVTDFDYGDGGYFVVMSKVAGWSGQTIKYGDEFPSDEIKKLWNEGYVITNMMHDGSDWIVVMSEVIYCKSQGYVVNTSWSEFKEFVHESWDQDMVATKLACNIQSGYNQYVAAVTEFVGRSPGQSMRYLSGVVTAQELCSVCDEGYCITDLYDFDGGLCVITSDEVRDRSFSIERSNSLRRIFDSMSDQYDEDYYIVAVCYYDGEWIVVYRS